MVSIAEASGNQSDLKGILDSGVDTLSNRQTVAFALYTRVALSSDGSVFWVKGATTLMVMGSLHYSTERIQDEDQTIGTNQVILTAEQEITEFNLIQPTQMWIGSWPVAGGSASLNIAFSRRGDYYGPADLWHYSGFAVYPALQAQLVNSSADLPTGPIVSNSLPIWLAFPAWVLTVQNFGIMPASLPPIYPSFLVPENITPPYIVAHVEPNGTDVLQAFPLLLYGTGPDSGPGFGNAAFGVTPFGNQIIGSSSLQLCRDRVRFTLYGFNNQAAQQIYQALIHYSEWTGNFGFANSPIIRDDKRIQREISAIAQKKTIDLTAVYYQAAADVLAQGLILEAFISAVTPQNPS